MKKNAVKDDNTVDKNKNKENVYVKNPDLKEEFTYEQLLASWEKFAEKNKKRTRIYNILLSKKPKINSNNIDITIDNPLQEEKINEIRNELVSYLRLNLKNSLIDLSFSKPDSNNDSAKAIYTDNDKLQYMINKNPNFKDLQQELNLDLDK